MSIVRVWGGSADVTFYIYTCLTSYNMYYVNFLKSPISRGCCLLILSVVFPCIQCLYRPAVALWSNFRGIQTCIIHEYYSPLKKALTASSLATHLLPAFVPLILPAFRYARTVCGVIFKISDSSDTVYILISLICSLLSIV